MGTGDGLIVLYGPRLTPIVRSRISDANFYEHRRVTALSRIRGGAGRALGTLP
jgi:hypothetical protein